MTLTTIKRDGLDADALDRVFTIGASGTDHYTFQGEGLNGTVNDPTLYLTRGKTYRFENGTGAHAIRIQSADDGTSGTLYNTGVTNNNTTGTVIVEVQHDAPDVLYYQCASHANMKGTIYVTGALPDLGVTTAKIADDAVDNDKLANSVVAAIAANTAKTSNATHTGDVTGSTLLTIAANAVETGMIEDEAVTLAKLEHGTSSNNGKFLMANNGADPTFETVTGTTINNNADNRVITGSGTANTLEGEAKLTFDGDKLTAQNSSNTSGIDLNISGSNPRIDFNAGSVASSGIIKSEESGSGAIMEFHNKNSSGSEQQVMHLTVDRNVEIDDGNLVIGTAGHGIDFSTASGSASGSSNALLDDYEEGTWTPYFECNNNSQTVAYNNSYHHGFYTKIGNLVYASCRFLWTSKSGNGNFKIVGLPFTSNSDGNKSQPCGMTVHYKSGFYRDVPTGYLIENTTEVQFGYGNGGGFSNMNFSNLSGSGEFNAHITYYV